MKGSVKGKEEGYFQDDILLHHLRQLYQASLLLAIREHLAQEYVSKKDFRQGMDDFGKRFDKLDAKIDTLIMKIKV